MRGPASARSAWPTAQGCASFPPRADPDGDDCDPVSATEHDADRIPVVVASGQAIERTELVNPVDLMVRACEAAFDRVPQLRGRVDRLSVVNVMTRVGPAPATEVARRTGMTPERCEVTTIGGNTPQWLVNRAASDIAAGGLSVTVIAGAEAIRSQRGRRAAGLPRDEADDLPEDPVVGDDQPGIGPGEMAIGLMAPVHVYPLFESVVAARAGHTAAQHRQVIGDLFAPFTSVAAHHPMAWFPQERSPAEIATPSPDNRIVAEPYTKLMTAFLGSDQGAALVVCSLAAARAAGVEDRAVFVWSGAEAVDVRFPTARPDPGRSPAIAAAGRALFQAASLGGGPSVGIDDVALIDLYSCFPSAVELGSTALGLATDDARGLTVTGGLPYFGGPGNNYTTHSIATLTELLREGAGGSAPTLGLATGLGWFITKHALGLYGTGPPPGGFRRGDTSADQAAIDASAADVALELESPAAAAATSATVLAATVIRDHTGAATGAPVIGRLPDGRHVAAAPADADVLSALSDADVPGMVGTQIAVEGSPPRYRQAGA
jgi:acetyl-CoA C-acetyltransferase